MLCQIILIKLEHRLDMKSDNNIVECLFHSVLLLCCPGEVWLAFRPRHHCSLVGRREVAGGLSQARTGNTLKHTKQQHAAASTIKMFWTLHYTALFSLTIIDKEIYVGVGRFSPQNGGEKSRRNGVCGREDYQKGEKKYSVLKPKTIQNLVETKSW